jgi:peroxiredoxin
MQGRSPLGYFVLALSTLFVSSAATAAAQTTIGFAERQPSILDVRRFSDRDVADAVATLDRMLPAGKDPKMWGAQAGETLWNFARHLQTGRLTRAQETLVLKHLDAIAAAHPDSAETVAHARFMVSALTVGKTAPDIVGRDLDGANLRLTDYRGKVVVLTFSAEWCGICRTLYPYQRLMLELYKNWPFAMVSVETGSSAAGLKQAKQDAGLPYRSWWDAPGSSGAGSIATAWNVGGFPTLYVIDREGVIRFVDLRYEDLLKGVRQLLSEEVSIASAATPGTRASQPTPRNN